MGRSFLRCRFFESDGLRAVSMAASAASKLSYSRSRSTAVMSSSLARHSSDGQSSAAARRFSTPNRIGCDRSIGWRGSGVRRTAGHGAGARTKLGTANGCTLTCVLAFSKGRTPGRTPRLFGVECVRAGCGCVPRAGAAPRRPNRPPSVIAHSGDVGSMLDRCWIGVEAVRRGLTRLRW